MIELVDKVSVDLINVSASDNMVAMAAWVSHDMDTEDRLKEVHRVRKLIHFLYKNKHMSPFEHGVFTFKIDAPLFVAREFFRHRTAAYNEVSGRYTEMKPRFYVGSTARIQKGKPGDYFFEEGSNEQTAVYLQTKRAVAYNAWEAYQSRLAAGIAKEQAREELPLSLMTQWYVTMSPRNLMHFLTLRNEEHALKEIQDVAVQMEEAFKAHMPITYEAYRAGRDNEREDVAAIRDARDDAQTNVNYLRAELRRTNEAMDAVVAERDEALRLRDEAVEAYNGAFVTDQEAKANPDEFIHTYETETPQGQGSYDKKIEDLVASTARAARAVFECAVPVYNIFVNNKEKVSEEAVAKALEIILKRNGRKF